MAADSQVGLSGKWRLDLDHSESSEPMLKAQKINAMMIKMVKSLRVQQEIKKGATDDEIEIILHMGKTVKVNVKTDHQPKEMQLDSPYGKSVVTAWWEDAVLMVTIEYNCKDVGPAIETVSRTLDGNNTMRTVVNWKTKDGASDVSMKRVFERRE
jgi:hypothetical protein